jgi:quercetin dioxygenase-like cupin family protein
VIVPRANLTFRPLPGRDAADPFREAPTGALSMRIVRLEGGRRRSPHVHPQSPEAIYVVSGTGALWENGVEQRIQAGDCALIAAGVPHATIPDPGTSMELVIFFPHPDLDANREELEDTVIRDEQERSRP